jgi:hypothetical protein
MSERKLLCQLFMTKRQCMDLQQCKFSVFWVGRPGTIVINHGTSKNVLTFPQTGSQFRCVKLAVEESDSNRISRSGEILWHKQNVWLVLMHTDNTKLPWCLLSDISRSYMKRCILLLWKQSQENDPYMFVNLVSCVFGD